MSLKILMIASLLPVPGLISENRIVIDHINNHLRRFPEDEFIVFRPSSFIPGFIGDLTRKKKYWAKHKEVIELSRYEIDGIKISVLPFISIGSIPLFHSILSSTVYFLNKRLINDIAYYKPDVIHANNLFPDGLLAYQINKRYKIPYCLTLRDERRMLNNPFNIRRARMILGKACFINTFSWLMKDKVESIKNCNVTLNSPGINNTFFQLLSESDNAGKIRFVTVANLLPVKNLDSVILAFSQLKDQNKNISYTIIGDGVEKDKLISLSRSLGIDEMVSFLPHIQNSNLSSQLIKYDVFIQPSFKETFGLSYFEALACGLPVLLTKNTGAYYHIKDKDCYLTVDPNNINDIRNKIEIAADRNWIRKRKKYCREASLVANWTNYTLRMGQTYKNCTSVGHY